MEALNRLANRVPVTIACIGLVLFGCVAETSEVELPIQPAQPTVQTPNALPDTQAQVTTAPASRVDLIKTINADLRGDLLELDLSYEGRRGNIFVRWDIAIDDTNDAIIEGAREDTVTILRAIALSGFDYQDVRLSGWYTLIIDINLNTQYQEVLNLYYTREKLDPMDWDNIRARYIWVISDEGAVHWLLQQ